MQTATLELTKGDWAKIVLSLKFAGEAVNWDSAYTKQVLELAEEIEELVAVQIEE